MRAPVRSTKGSITGHDCRDAGGRATQEQLPRTAREDVDAGDARRARAKEGPSQSLPLRLIQPPSKGAGYTTVLHNLT